MNHRRIGAARWVLLMFVMALLPLGSSGGAQMGRAAAAAVAPKSRVPSLGPQVENQWQQILPKISHRPAALLATKYGMTAIRGKRVDLDEKVGPARYRMEVDNSVGTSFLSSENEPSVAANPADGSLVVIFAHNIPADPCRAWFSIDSGETFQSTFFVDLPVAAVGDFCSDPVVRFSPDGTVAYYAYVSIHLGMNPVTDPDTSSAVVCTAPGSTPWDVCVSPAIALPSLGNFVDKEWMDVHTFDTGAGANVVYVSATEFTTGGSCNIIFNRSLDAGVTWDLGTAGEGIVLAPSATCNPVLHGSRPAGAPGANVLVCWYNSEADGWLTGVFDIRCRRNADYGSTTAWDAQVTALDNRAFETPFWLCPSASLHRWWGGMFPAITIDHLGRAHLTVTYDPTAGATTTECGNVLYRRSLAPPYTVWGTPIVVGSDTLGRAQGYPTVVAQRAEATLPRVYVAYYGHKNAILGGVTVPNGRYDVFYRRSVDGGTTFGAAVRVTDVSSVSDFVFIGDYIDSSATVRVFHVAWTDRADKLSIDDGEDDVYHDRFP